MLRFKKHAYIVPFIIGCKVLVLSGIVFTILSEYHNRNDGFRFFLDHIFAWCVMCGDDK